MKNTETLTPKLQASKSRPFLNCASTKILPIAFFDTSCYDLETEEVPIQEHKVAEELKTYEWRNKT
jgi:hypothetical protein